MRTDIVDELNGLAVHYPRLVRSEAEHESWLRDYLADLGDMPIEAIRLGCRAWRQSTAKKFPTLGELLAISRQNLPETRSEARAWSPSSDAEYDAMSITDKIREQMLLANDALMRAGPQMINRKPTLPADMPEPWRRWKAKGANHQAEVKRLREKLAEHRGAA